MPAGCEFICTNRSCEHFNNGFNMTAPWPMGRIELVLNATNVKKDEKLRNGLIKFKNEGRKYACITYPNVSSITPIAYRVHMWSNGANCIWQYDVVMDGSTSVKDLISKSDIPTVCPTSGVELWDFEKTIKNGILCPHCSMPMKQCRWFSNEEK